MKSLPGFVSRFKTDIKNVPEHIRRAVNRPGGLDENNLLQLLVNPPDHTVSFPSIPPEDSVEDLRNGVCEAKNKLGQSVLESGSVAFCILAGGAGTRIGQPKALLRVPDIEITLLSIKLLQAIGTGPVWILTTPSLRNQISFHVDTIGGFDKSRIEIIDQYESYRLTPDNQIIFSNDGVDLHPCGHGDIFSSLTSSGLLQSFVNAGGKYVFVSNVDNLLAGPSPHILGHHIDTKSFVTCEVIEKTGLDTGGVLCNVGGKLQIVESFRLGKIDLFEYKWLNTNSFIFNADLDLSDLGTVWHRIRKIIDNRVVIQHERMLQELTAVFDTKYVCVNREDRFMPIKNSQDLLNASMILNANRKVF